MKLLKDHIILYDAECPMCTAFTKAFVKAGMLRQEGRVPYQHMPEQVCHMVDRQRAVNEIALVNTATGEVSYGINSLFDIIGPSFPIFKPLFSFKPFAWLMGKFYAFVSYNRRAIVPPAKKEELFAIQPTFRRNYRLVYFLVTWLLASFIFSHYASLLPNTLPVHKKGTFYAVFAGLLIFQAFIAIPVAKEKVWDYLGNMMTGTLIGGLLLLPMLLISKWITLDPIWYTGYLILVAIVMLLTHIRRARLLKLSPILTVTWVDYWLLAFGVLYYFS